MIPRPVVRKFLDRPPDLGVQSQCGRGDANSHQTVGFAGDLTQRINWGIRSELGNVEASPAQQVSHHGHGQCVEISSGSSNDDGATTSARPPELEAEATDDPLRHGGGSVLVGDAHISVGPPRTDGSKCRGEERRDDSSGVEPAAEATLDQPPCTSAVSSQQARFKRSAGASRGPAPGPRAFGGYPTVLQCVDIAGSNPPDEPVLRGRKLPGAHIAIDGHVVQSELFGSFLKRDGPWLCGHSLF